MEFEKLTEEEKTLYSEIEHLIIMWGNDGTKTTSSLTREIMDLIIVHNSIYQHEPQSQSYDSDTGIQITEDMEKYHQAKLKKIRITDVSGKSEQCNHVFQRVERGGEFQGNQCECGEWEDLT